MATRGPARVAVIGLVVRCRDQTMKARIGNAPSQQLHNRPEVVHSLLQAGDAQCAIQAHVECPLPILQSVAQRPVHQPAKSPTWPRKRSSLNFLEQNSNMREFSCATVVQFSRV